MGSVAIGSTAPAGRVFVRSLIARALHSADIGRFAAQRWGASAGRAVEKTAVSAITANDVGDPESRAFFALAVEQSLLGRMEGLRRVPFNTRFTRQTVRGVGSWVAEGSAIPLSKAAVQGSSLAGLKVAAITVTTKESLEAMGEVTEAALQRDLVDSVAGALDVTFVNPDFAGTPEESPASVAYAGTKIASSGNVKADVEALFANFTGNLRRTYIVMNPMTAVQIGLADAQIGDTKLGVNGGVLAGVPVLCSEHVPFTSDGGSITILDAGAIAYAARDVDFSISRDTTLQMSDEPDANSTTPAAGVIQSVSMYQTNCVAWKVTAEANWSAQGSGKVVTITGVDYAQGS